MAITQGFVRRRNASMMAVVALFALLATGCAQQVGKGHALNKLGDLESDLTRGISKKSDVLFLLGEPDGSGGALLPTAAAPSEIWYYEDSKVSLSSVKQSILLVYFEDDLFAGYQWFSNAATMDLQ